MTKPEPLHILDLVRGIEMALQAQTPRPEFQVLEKERGLELITLLRQELKKHGLVGQDRG